MKQSYLFPLLFLISLQFAGLTLFARGFFPYKTYVPGFASVDDTPPLPNGVKPEGGIGQEPIFGRMVFMLVDALRNDFVFGPDSGMLFVKNLIANNTALPFTAIASAPTVTLPRIKSLTTGTIPSFLDAILNIAESDTSSSLAYQDNWVHQLWSMGKKINFYGDDTWLKLFPGMFKRWEGTSSFYVTDTVEVDLNVTRHLPGELARADWDVLILHYLGLDHIGHKDGPSSPLMLPKQREMDTVARNIYETLLRQDEERKSRGEKPTLFVLCGDHGMNEVGNHGGSSLGEVSTALVLMSNEFKNIGFAHHRTIDQYDIVPTLSLLLGLPIPQNNLGLLVPEPFAGHDLLRAMQINAAQLSKVVQSRWENFDVLVKKEAGEKCETKSEDGEKLACLYRGALNHHLNSLSGDTARGDEAMLAYREFSALASSLLSRTASNYDLVGMFQGIFLLITAAIGLTYFSFTQARKPALSADKGFMLETRLFNGALLAYLVSLFGSSYIEEEHLFFYYLTGSLWLVHFLASVKHARKEKGYRISWYIPIAQMGVLRILRSWNQTGQKRAGNIDIRHHLTTTHTPLLWALFLFTLTLIPFLTCKLAFKRIPRRVPRIPVTLVFSLTIGVSLLITVYKIGTDSVLEMWITAKQRLWLAWLVYVCIGALTLCIGCIRWQCRREKDIIERQKVSELLSILALSTTTLFLTLLSRPHNAPLFLLFMAQLFLYRSYLQYSPDRPPHLHAATFLTLAHTSFYALGNSNSLASIDLNNAYIGISGYTNAVGALTFISNWAGPIWWTVGWALGVGETNGYLFRSSFFSLALAALSVSVLVLREHLFIWTVFSPKYLYQASWSVLYHGIVGGMVAILGHLLKL
ncbi:uncharacterized protein VTP21DRAFT_6785 [Calcarisporiella thermophila]|uniref:uncharacterized protein n=1 Tax=Calcarisporiella thermophila TaxID=911321 RepID=UPI0037426D14